MAIFKNFPKVSSITRDALMTEEDALLVYKINRYDFTPPQIFNFLRSLNSEKRSKQLALLMDWYDQHFIKPSTHRLLMRLIEIMIDNPSRSVKFMGYNPRSKCEVFYIDQGLITDPTLLFYLHEEGTIRIGTVEESYSQTVNY